MQDNKNGGEKVVYPEHRVVSSLAHSCHILGDKGKIALIDSLASLSLSISPVFLSNCIYCKQQPNKISTPQKVSKKKLTLLAKFEKLLRNENTNPEIGLYLNMSIVVGGIAREVRF